MSWWTAVRADLRRPEAPVARSDLPVLIVGTAVVVVAAQLTVDRAHYGRTGERPRRTALGRQEDWEEPAGRSDAARDASPDLSR